MMNTAILEMSGISKRFGATRALSDMRLAIRAGEIHALMGENGAGKSTLMKILSGVYQPDSGQILLDGKPIAIKGPSDGRRAGINLIYQELSVSTNLTVAENVFMGSEPRGRFGLLDRSNMRMWTNDVLALLGAPFTADTHAGKLSIAEQQQVEIARALIHKGRILIMDEPTAALSDRETEHLFRVVRKLRDEGIAVIYISHRMAEVHALADRVTILRDGSYVGEMTRDELDPGRIVQMMVGRPLGDFYQHKAGRVPGRVMLEVENLSGARVKPASFSVRAGEVVGLAGLVGAGRTELARLIFGADRKHGGRVKIDGVAVDTRDPLTAIRLGIGYLPEDRKGQGLFLQLSALTNTTLNVVRQHCRAGIINHQALETLTNDAIARLNIKVPGPHGIVGGLSGGNQQKVLLARWLEIKPRVLILDEPTRGVDVGAKSEIYRIIHELALNGVAVVVISSELPEVIGICDRVVVMREGHISGEVSGDAVTQENIMTLATHASEPAANAISALHAA
ncbi:Ribose import ATP-binding protein RbsA [Andreprevotia sp. IGB-42]|uniref:sugar ABC transporter ATP-binding protein n=1 Tax=Andreprevotia sp. IGB-42 TaxID=2497473 RepID=UPI00157EF99E|nr:sugar ABC transporter ATP-binding protein [Andreprevotia sp. IGB-42]KAF0813819.1 Ribose import ATP-binding protein RbsA [Andreprevotia sp. IGB-42]